MLPLALLRVLLALGRDPRLSVCGFLLTWEHNLFSGWHAFALGMAIALIVVAKLVETGDDPRAAARVIPWSALLALTHAMASLYALVAGALLVAAPRPTGRRAKAFTIAFSGMAISLLSWLALRTRASGPEGPPSPWKLDYPTVADKVTGVFAFTLDNLRGPFGELTAAAAFGLLVIGPLAFVAARTTAPLADDEAQRWSGAKLALAALLLYAALPMAIYGPLNHWYTYPRFASYLLLALPLVPPVRRVATGWLAVVVVVALAGNVATTHALAGFGARVRPFSQLADLVPPGARLLPLEYVDQDEAVKAAPLAHVHSYLTAKGLYDPHMFDNHETPIRYRAGLDIPRISWLGPRDFTLARYAPHYDYMLVQGLAADPFVQHPADAGYHVRLLKETGMWRLYAVEKD
jgi:hypothetical protein